MRSRLGWLLVLASIGCSSLWSEPVAPRRARASTSGAPDAPRVVAMGRSVLARLRARELPAGIDGLLDQLLGISRDGRGPRAIEARRVAAELATARYEITRQHSDFQRADELWTSLAEGASGDDRALACTAIFAGAELSRRAHDDAAARGRYLAYERRCSDQPGMPNVHATLALIDPTVARAESAARTASRRLETPAPGETQNLHGLRRIVIDAGHGGSDPGARGALGTSESEVALDVARRLADRLSTSLGVDVVLTRDADVYLDLESRVVRANRAGGDLFLSIHCNSAPNSESRGVSTYVLETSSDRVHARVAAREQGDVDSDPIAETDVFRILADLRLGEQGSRSFALASAVQHGMLAALGERYADIVDLGVHPARFHVLVGARMPAVLVELSFISHPIEELRLRDPAYRTLLADAIARAVASYRD